MAHRDRPAEEIVGGRVGGEQLGDLDPGAERAALEDVGRAAVRPGLVLVVRENGTSGGRTAFFGGTIGYGDDAFDRLLR
jgi:hypothetical protein